MLSIFPVERREDEAEFGVYRIRDLTTVCLNALAAEDANTVVSA